MANENEQNPANTQAVTDGSPQAGNSTTQAVNESNNSQNNNNSEVNSIDTIMRELREARNEAKNLRTRLKDFESSKEEADKQALAEQGKFKELHEKAEARVKELEPVAERYQQLNQLAVTRAQAEVKDWPKEVKDLLPSGENLDALAYLDAVEKFKPLATRLAQPPQGRPGNPASPTPADQPQPGQFKLDYSKVV
jgi:DNA repair ATPase RecN